jgi:hypothetical protein
MIGEITTQPFVPGFVDFSDGLPVTFRSHPAFHQGGDAQIDANEMGIGAKMIADHHPIFACKLGERVFDPAGIDFSPPQRCRQLGYETGLLCRSPQKPDDSRFHSRDIVIVACTHIAHSICLDTIYEM